MKMGPPSRDGPKQSYYNFGMVLATDALPLQSTVPHLCYRAVPQGQGRPSLHGAEAASKHELLRRGYTGHSARILSKFSGYQPLAAAGRLLIVPPGPPLLPLPNSGRGFFVIGQSKQTWRSRKLPSNGHGHAGLPNNEQAGAASAVFPGCVAPKDSARLFLRSFIQRTLAL